MTRVASAVSRSGPALHVVDLEGLAIRFGRSAPHRRQGGMGPFHRALVLAYASAARLRAEDHTMLLHLEAFVEGCALTVAAPCQWLGEWGPVRLTPVECLMRYERVIVGSGSALLAPFADALREVGLPVTVVHRVGLVSPALAQAADALVPLRRVNRRRAAANAVEGGWISEFRRP